MKARFTTNVSPNGKREGKNQQANHLQVALPVFQESNTSKVQMIPQVTDGEISYQADIGAYPGAVLSDISDEMLIKQL